MLTKRLLIILGASVVLAVAAPAPAQTPTCGTVISTPGATITFDSDMDCGTGFMSIPLIVAADGVIVDGAGFGIIAPDAPTILEARFCDGVTLKNLALGSNTGTGLYLNQVTNSTIEYVTASGSGNVGAGIQLYGSIGIHVRYNTVHARAHGIRLHAANSDLTVNENDLSNNNTGIAQYGSGGPPTNNTYTGNDVSYSSFSGISLAGEVNLNLGENDYTGCTNGLTLANMDAITLSGLDFSPYNIPGTALSLSAVTNSIIEFIDGSGTGNTGVGIQVYACDGTVLRSNTVHGRAHGLRMHVSNSNLTIIENNLSGNNIGIADYASGGVRANNSLVGNNVSGSLQWGINLAGQINVTLEDNDFTACTNGLALNYMDSVTLDGIDFSIFNIPGTALGLGNVTNSIIQNINASGSAGGGVGIALQLCDAVQVTNNTITGRWEGIVLSSANSNLTVAYNTVTGNRYGIVDKATPGVRDNNTIVRNDVSGSLTWGIYLVAETNFTLNNNTYTDCANGLYLAGLDAITLTGLDFSGANIPGTALSLNGVTNSVITGINASGSGGSGYGIGLASSSGNTIEFNVVHGRQNGIRTNGELNNNTFRNNDLSDNILAFYDYPAGTRSGTIITDNDFSRSTHTGINLFNHTGLTLQRNTYTDCANGLLLSGVDAFTMTDRDFSTANIPGTVIALTSVTNSTFSEINASGSGGGVGIKLTNTSGNAFLGNTINGRQTGIFNTRAESHNLYVGNDLSGNVQAISDYAVSTPRVGNVYSHNLMVGSGHTAMRLWMEESAIIKDNTISGGALHGIEITNSSNLRIFRNNIQSNSGYQVASASGNTGISLSESGQGNYWGRTCPGPLFVAGTDSNSADVVDSFPYSSENQWLTGDPPGCDPQVCLDGGPYTADAHTLLLLHFDGTYDGANGETPTSTTGTFEEGAFDQGVDATPTEYVWLQYPADGNIDTSAGTLEFWIKPNWAGDDGMQHTLFSAYGSQAQNHLLINKNTANNHHLIFWDGDGAGYGPWKPVYDWDAGEWHHLAYTWNATEMQMFIDGVLVSTSPAPSVPIAVDTLNFSHSVGDQTPIWGWGPDAVVDEFRISNIRRCVGTIVPPGPVDNDGDGYAADVDCDDDDFNINPGATEVCDLLDNNCDGVVDDLGTETCGLGVCEHTIDLCVNGVPQTCDPFEGATDELCDLFDNDCDGVVDDLGTETCGLGVCEHTIDLCINGITQDCDPFEGAIDETCDDGLDNDCNGVVDDAADLLIQADHHLVGGGSHPGSTKAPIEGLLVGIYDKADGSCARDVCGGISWQHYQCIVASCDAVTTEVTDPVGQIDFALATGDYLLIGDDGTDKHLGVSASDLVCGDTMHKYLQRLETANGKRHPGKTSKRTGSELLVIEPEYVEWSGVDELYPFVFESVGDWDVTTSVEPPEGFVTDYDQLAEQVDNELEAVQFTITDVGSDWVPTGSQHVLEHNGRREILVGRVGVLVAPGLALAKGLDREGHPLGPDGHPIHGPGFDPRAPRPVEVVGWIEATAVDPLWVFKLRVDETSDFTLAITRGQGLVERTLFDGQLTAGEYELDWDGTDDRGHPLLPGIHWLTLSAGDMIQKEVFIKQ